VSGCWVYRENRGGQPDDQRPGRIPTAEHAVAAFVVVFILKNRDWTTIDFVLFEMRNRVWTAIAFSIGLGVLLDRLVLMWWRRRKAERATA
jgi:hypothetical protein